MKRLLFLIMSGIMLLAGSVTAQQRVYQTLMYDNNTYNTGIGGDDGLFLWAVKFETSQFAMFRTIDTVHLYGSNTQAAELFVVQGNTPNGSGSTVIYRQSVNMVTSVWNHYPLSTPATLDNTKPLWIIFKARHGFNVPVASACIGTTVNAAWYSEDSTSWKNIVNEGYSYNFMVRATVSAPGAAPTYTLTVDCDTTLGRVVGGGTYTAGDTAVISAFPNPGCLFLYWNDGNTANPRRVVMDANKSFRAEFVRDDDETQYTITVTCDPDRGTVTGGGTYYAGQSVTITATPFTGYTFRNWSDGNADNPRTIVVSQNLTLRANFVDGNGNGGDNPDGIEQTTQVKPTIVTNGRQLTVATQQNTEYSIVDIQGRVLKSGKASDGTIQHTFEHSGVYMLRLSGLPTRKIYVK